MTNWYATRAALKTRLGVDDTTDDAVFDEVIFAVSREIDQWTHRWFYPATQTRRFQARASSHVVVDDLLSVTSLSTDADGDRVYELAWATTDYDLEPANALLDNPPQPYHEIRVAPLGRYSFPRHARGVQIAGVWGYYDQRRTSSATLNEDLDTSETGVDVTSGPAFDVGQTILIDSEQMWISAISTNTLTVTRAVNGTTAAAHTSGAAIQIYRYPVVSEACLLQAGRLVKRKDSPFGVLGSADFGGVRIVSLDPDVKRLLAPFVRRTVA